MALIRLEEAIDLGLVPQSAMSRFPAVGRSQLFGSPLQLSFGSLRGYRPGGGPLERGVRFPSRFGIAPVRFGLGPLMAGLGLSPAASAVGAPGAVPVGRTPMGRRRTEEEQALIEEMMRRSGALPTARPTTIPSTQQDAQVAQVRALAEQMRNRGTGPDQVLGEVQRALNFAKSIADPATLAGQIVMEAFSGQPSVSLGSDVALQAQRAGERGPFGATSVVPEGLTVADVQTLEGVLGPLSARELALLTPEDVGQLAGLARTISGTAGTGTPSAEGTGGTASLPTPTPSDLLSTFNAVLALRQGNLQGGLVPLTTTGLSLLNRSGLARNLPLAGAASLGAGLAGAGQSFASDNVGQGVAQVAQTGLGALANPGQASFVPGLASLSATAVPGSTGTGLAAGAAAAEGGTAAAGGAGAGAAAGGATSLGQLAGGLAVPLAAAGLLSLIPGAKGPFYQFRTPWQLFGGRLRETLQLEHEGIQGLIDELKASQTQGDLRQAWTNLNEKFNQQIGDWYRQVGISQLSGGDVDPVGRRWSEFETNPEEQVHGIFPTPPGATGTAHEWNQVADFEEPYGRIRQAFVDLYRRLPNMGPSGSVPNYAATRQAQLGELERIGQHTASESFQRAGAISPEQANQFVQAGYTVNPEDGIYTPEGNRVDVTPGGERGGS